MHVSANADQTENQLTRALAAGDDAVPSDTRTETDRQRTVT